MTEIIDWGLRARDLLAGRGIAVDENAGVDAQLESTLLATAERVCDFHGDGPAARAEMKRACLALSHAHKADILDHFNAAYPTAIFNTTNT